MAQKDLNEAQLEIFRVELVELFLRVGRLPDNGRHIGELVTTPNPGTLGEIA